MVKKILTDYSTIHLTQCLRKWETIINVGPTEEIIFKFLKRKLGTCYWRKNIIELDIKLVCFPEDVFKVVVIHELCHYIEPNHGPNFHRLQDKYCPDNKELHKQIFSAIYDTEDESEE
jgi:predicted metal-dependent hydrolase